MPLISSHNSGRFHHTPRFMPKSRNALLSLVVFSTAVTSTSIGYDSMVMAGVIAVPQFTNFFHLNPTINGLMNASLWMGGLIACLFTQYLSDHYGRKRAIIISSLVSFVGVILQTASTSNIGMFIFARLVIGISNQLAGTASPLLIAEISPKLIRGFMVGLYFTCFNVGAIIASGVTYGSVGIPNTWAWRLPSLIQAAPSALSLLLLFIVPESPRWKIANGQLEYAVEVFQVIDTASEKEARAYVHQLKQTIDDESISSKSAWTVLLHPSQADKQRLIIVFTFAMVVELAGSSVGSWYLTIIMRQAGITNTDKLLQINLISSCWNFVCAVVGSYMFDHIGRKRQAIGAMIGMIATLFLLGGFVKMYGESNNKAGQYATIFFMFLFNGCYNFSITPLNCLYPSELFPMKTRAAGTTIFKFWNSGFGLLGTFILPIAMTRIGWKFYVINASYDVVLLALAYMYWVETKGMSLEEIGRLLGDTEVCIPELDGLECISELNTANYIKK